MRGARAPSGRRAPFSRARVDRGGSSRGRPRRSARPRRLPASAVGVALLADANAPASLGWCRGEAARAAPGTRSSVGRRGCWVRALGALCVPRLVPSVPRLPGPGARPAAHTADAVRVGYQRRSHRRQRDMDFPLLVQYRYFNVFLSPGRGLAYHIGSLVQYCSGKSIVVQYCKIVHTPQYCRFVVQYCSPVLTVHEL